MMPLIHDRYALSQRHISLMSEQLGCSVEMLLRIRPTSATIFRKIVSLSGKGN
jgi:hypothetical protein